jgi:hypothetical protein
MGTGIFPINELSLSPAIVRGISFRLIRQGKPGDPYFAAAISSSRAVGNPGGKGTPATA